MQKLYDRLRGVCRSGTFRRKTVMSLYCFFVFLPMLLFLPGCAWFRDNRPEPSGSPYAADVKTPKKIYTEAEAVNAAVSAISLRMAVSSEGPFRVIPTDKKTTSLGFKVIGSLDAMRLSRLSAPSVLHLEDARTEGSWRLVLQYSDGRVFVDKTFQLNRSPEQGAAGKSPAKQ